MRRVRRAWAILAVAGGLGCLHAEDVAVAVAANFKVPAEAIAVEFEKKTGHRVMISPGATGALATQIRHGAPFHVFLSADTPTPEMLISDGLAVRGTGFTYAIGRLVLWSATAGVVDDAGRVLSEGSFRKLALVNPKTAPYGAAALEVLGKMQLLAQVEPRFVQAENIAQAYQFVASGNAEIGFVAFSQVCREGKIASGSGWIVPQELYSPIRQDAVLLKLGQDSEAAKAWLDFLKGDPAGKIIASFGYLK